MSDPGSVLRELHRIHIQLGDLRERLDGGPKQLKAKEAAVTKLEAETAQIKAEQKAARVASDQKQLLLKSGETKQKELNAKLMAAQSNREYQALKDQIAADNMANSVLQDEILESLEKLDGFTKLIGEAEQRVARAKEELAKTRLAVESQHESLIGDVNRLEAELKVAEQNLPGDYQEIYVRSARSRGSESMAVVEGENCGGCYHVITANMFNNLLVNKVVTCQSCGRLLYLPEDRSPGRRK